MDSKQDGIPKLIIHTVKEVLLKQKTEVRHGKFRRHLIIRQIFGSSLLIRLPDGLSERNGDVTVQGSKLLNFFILHTNDGGKTWVAQFKELAGEKWGIEDGLFDVLFIDQNEGWVIGSLVLHTKNGGKHWEHQKSGTKLNLSNVQFINARKDG